MRKNTELTKAGLALAGAAAVGASVYTVLRKQAQPLPEHPVLAENQPLVVAHRGGAGLWPPNTLYAFERAVAMGVDMLEMDVHPTADGVLVVRHNDTVDETTNGSGAIRDLTLAQIKELDAGYTWSADNGLTHPYRGQGITIPSFDEVLSAFPGVPMTVDIKSDNPEVVRPFGELLRKHNKLGEVFVGSFHDSQLSRYRKLCPESGTVAGERETLLFLLLQQFDMSAVFQARAETFQLPEKEKGVRIITPDFIRRAHEHNIKVLIWTVNLQGDMQRLLDWGVDGIITDYPDRLMELLGRERLDQRTNAAS
ncbi:MAG TPA: glycerophosphodiester phosphodiesterase [Anaerolineales bacterium]|nr:glycerophosphodiester phosphodiesterase [Anaerolineales bacterium]